MYLGDFKLDLVRRDGGATPKPAFRASAGNISLPGGVLRPPNGRVDPSKCPPVTLPSFETIILTPTFPSSPRSPLREYSKAARQLSRRNFRSRLAHFRSPACIFNQSFEQTLIPPPKIEKVARDKVRTKVEQQSGLPPFPFLFSSSFIFSFFLSFFHHPLTELL